MELEESRSLDLSDDTSSQSDHLLEKYPQFLLRSFSPREQYSRRFHTPGVIALLYVAIVGLSASLVYFSIPSYEMLRSISRFLLYVS
jgi:hypothetical protein